MPATRLCINEPPRAAAEYRRRRPGSAVIFRLRIADFDDADFRDEALGAGLIFPIRRD